MAPAFHRLLPTLFVLSIVTFASAQEARPSGRDESREKIIRAAEGFSLAVGGKVLKMQADPVLRWPNQTRDVPDGATFVWTLDGRPLAVGCVWQFRGLWFAFHSLSREPIQATLAGKEVWACEKQGITLESFNDTPVPASTVAARTTQMRNLARRFNCRLYPLPEGVGRGKEDLRLLPQPIYQSDLDGDKLTDLALFAFAQGTDPEVILLLDATDSARGKEWRYALTRRSMHPLEADLDGKKIWAVEGGAGTRSGPWFHSGVTLAVSQE